MQMDCELLRRYADTGSEPAFAELVSRYVNLIYSAALRQLNGDTHLAQDVVQGVFCDLARKAGTLLQRQSLSGWLYTSTHHGCAKAIRAECRRRAHEEKAQEMQALLQNNEPDLAWETLKPVLDSALHELDESDRELILLRYFENRPWQDVGQSAGISDEAARKRIDRALEKLRAVLVRRGISAVSSLAATISAHAVQAAPAGLAATLAAGAVAGSAISAVTTAALTKTVAMTATQKSLLAALLAILLGANLYQVHRTSLLQEQVRSLKQEQSSASAELERVQAERRSLAQAPASQGPSSPASTERLRELLRLRGEVGLLRRQQRELQQALLAANSIQSNKAPAPLASPRVLSPFQVQLVSDQPGEDTETLTNTSSGTNGEIIRVNKTPLMDYTAIQSATVTPSGASGEPQIDIELSPEGKELFAAITRDNLNKRLAIVMDGQVYAAPIIRSEIQSGKASITGHFTRQQAEALAAQINEKIRER